MNYEPILISIGALLSIAFAILGTKYKQGKNKANKLSELLNSIINCTISFST